MFIGPFGCVDCLRLSYALTERMPDRHGKPLPARLCLDLVAVLPAVFLKLHRIENDKDIGAVNLVEIPGPGR